MAGAYAKKPGKTRQKLAQILTRDLGFDVAPEDLWQQTGAHRKGTFDCARWGIRGTTYSSWETMGDIVKAGGAVTSERLGVFEIFSALPTEIEPGA